MVILIVRLVLRVLVIVVHVLVGSLIISTTWVICHVHVSTYCINSCVIFLFTASMLEMARLTVDSGWVPPRPIIFLFNGAEELFLLVSKCCITLRKRNYFTSLGIIDSVVIYYHYYYYSVIHFSFLFWVVI